MSGFCRRLCRNRDWPQRLEVGLIRRLPSQALMWPPADVVELQILSDGSAGLGHAGVGLKVDLLLLDAFPDALDEDVIPPSPFPVHADLDAVPDRQTGKFVADGQLRGSASLRLLSLMQVMKERLEARVCGQCCNVRWATAFDNAPLIH